MKLVTVFTSISVNEVYYVKSLLETNDIEAVILDDTIAQIAPHYLFGQGGPRLAVAEEDAKAAQEIVDDYYKSKKDAGSDVDESK